MNNIPDYQTRMKLARDPNTLPEILEELAEEDDYYWIRMHAIYNQNTPESSLWRIAHDDNADSWLREEALLNFYKRQSYGDN